jgi:hypothetical protein
MIKTSHAVLLLLVLGGMGPAPHGRSPVGRVIVDLSAGAPAASFRPDQAFGAALDGVSAGEIASSYTAHNLAAVQRAGLGPISYRLRTELGIEAWHWSEEGTWSDPGRAQGYWVSRDRPSRPVMISHGYSLPRRGDTVDQANNSGYSRLDDGDPATFWKSNPYLDVHYTHEKVARPQWVVVELPKATLIGAAKLSWGEPYATRYVVQYWSGENEYDPAGKWIAFPQGAVSGGRGG